MAEKTIETSVVSFLSKFPELFRQSRAESLEEFNAVLYNEYTTLIEQSLLGLDYLPAILDRIQYLLAASQTTAVSLLTGLPEVDVLGTLDKVSTKRSALDNAARSGKTVFDMAMLAGESTGRHSLPSYDNLALAVGESRRRVAGESTDTDKTGTSFNSTKDLAKMLTDQEGLSGGRLFGITFERNGNKAEYPMRIRLDVKSVPGNVMGSLICLGSQYRSFWERYIRAAYKGNRKGSWVDRLAAAKDVFFMNDLMEEYRKNRFRDKSGYYKKMMEKKNGNWLSGLLSFSPSINNASGVMIVSQDTLDGLTAELGGDFDEFSIRQRVFQNTLTVYYVVIDPVWKRVTIYTRGLDGKQEMDSTDFGKNKGGADVNKIVEAYRAGQQPIL